jgi:hypothetical protein
MGLAAAKPTARKPVPQYRTWTDSTGSHTTRAAFQGVEEGNVKLRKTDGKTITVALDRLSKADQEWVANQATATAAASAVEWPTFLGSNHDGKSSDKGLLKEWPEQGPPLAWKVNNIGVGYSSVSVAGGTVYVTGESGDHLILFAFDTSGHLKWRTDHGVDQWKDHPGARASVTVDGDSVYLLGSNGGLGCYSTQNGQRKWAHAAQEFGGQPGRWGYAETVLIWDNLAIFKPGGRNFMVALDKISGRLVWASQAGAAGPEYSSCLPVVFQGTAMIVTGSSKGLVCVSPRNGALMWVNSFAAGNTANCPTPAFGDGYVFWANGYKAGGVCVKLGSGGKASEAWKTGDMVCHHGGYIIDNGHVYGNHNGGWACIELATGKTKWTDRSVGKGSLCWADDMLYLFTEKGEAALGTCSPKGLTIKGRMKVAGDGPSWAHPVVVGGQLYLRYDTNLYCYDVKGK